MLLSIFSALFAQDRSTGRTLKGTVTDDGGTPLQAATVAVQGGRSVVTTDKDGHFEIFYPSGAKGLSISFVGMQSQNLTVKENANNLLVKLKPNSANALNDVVVIGYGTVKRKDLTGSVSTISAADLSRGNPSNVVSAMQGKVAGAVISTSDGAPGAGISIQVRGANSFISAQPLYVIDGIPYAVDNSNVNGGSSQSGDQASGNALAFLNPSDIESIEILKDASATAIYGSRGANGVVMITTKKGKRGADKVEFNGTTGIAMVDKKIKVLNAYQYALMRNEAVSNANYFEPTSSARALPFPGAVILDENGDSTYSSGPKDYIGKGTDWQKEIFQTGAVQNLTLNVSGASDKGNYMLSGNFLNQQGVIATSQFRQYGLRLNLYRNVNKWLVAGSNSNFATSTNTMVKTNNEDLSGGIGVVKSALAFAPTTELNDSTTRTFNVSTSITNPYVYVHGVKNLVLVNQFFTSNYLEATILPGLKFRQNIGYNLFQNQREQYFPRTVYEGYAVSGLAYDAQGWYTSFTSESILTFMKKIKQHDLNIMGGATSEYDYSRSKTQQVSGFVNDILQDNNLSGGTTITAPTTSRTKNTLVSFLGRITDNFMGRYMVTFSLRADGSSKFGDHHKWGYFPSAAFAWNISDEPFMDKLQKVISLAKLRLSYGRTGNQGISAYQTMTQLTTANYAYNGSLSSGYADNYWSGPGNNLLKWETTDQYDMGLDLGFLQNRINFHLDGYYKKTRDLLQYLTIPSSTGFGTEMVNSGAVTNRGLEITLNAIAINGQDFKWNIGGNFSINRNKITALGYGNTIQYATRINTNGDQPFVEMVGKPIGTLYGYVENGIYKNEAEVRTDPWYANQPDAIIKRAVGEVRYKDVNGDGSFTSSDKTIIGDVNPKFTYGFTSDFSYKHFDLSFLIQGVYGNDIINMNHYFLFNMGDYDNVLQDQWNNRWTFDNWQHATAPKAENQYWRQTYFTRRFIENGSYVRLKNVTLSYTVPLNVKWMNSLKCYLSGTNLLTLTKYKGFDPDINGYGNDPTRRGVDMGGYPGSKTFTLGVQCQF